MEEQEIKTMYHIRCEAGGRYVPCAIKCRFVELDGDEPIYTVVEPDPFFSIGQDIYESENRSFDFEKVRRYWLRARRQDINSLMETIEKQMRAIGKLNELEPPL